MGIFSCELEVPLVISPVKMFESFTVNAKRLYPKVAPQAFQSVEILQGDGGVGTIKKLNFGPSMKFNYAKQLVEKMDKDELVYGYSVIEGNVLMEKMEKISNELKFVASPDGGCICKVTSKYYTIGDAEMKEEEITSGKQTISGFLKAMEAYLLANPDA